jgi:lipopolysaccharide/colanic/teichoic acid biosynthesis glycosyltransferase
MAIVLFTLTWPIMLLTAILIKLDEGVKTPVFYSQERVGVDGEPFNIFKFRSMRLDAEKFGAQIASENDPRITKTGNVLRKYRIDELPQIYNVMRGDMGFVGPRPERPEFGQSLIKNIPYYNISIIDDNELLTKVSEEGLLYVQNDRNWLNRAKQYLPVYQKLQK